MELWIVSIMEILKWTVGQGCIYCCLEGQTFNNIISYFKTTDGDNICSSNNRKRKINNGNQLNNKISEDNIMIGNFYYYYYYCSQK